MPAKPKLGPVLKPKSVKKLETFFFETLLNAKLGRESRTNRMVRLRLRTNRMVRVRCIGCKIILK